MTATPEIRAVAPTVPALHWVLWLVGTALLSLALGFAVGLARPRQTSLAVRAGTLR